MKYFLVLPFLSIFSLLLGNNSHAGVKFLEPNQMTSSVNPNNTEFHVQEGMPEGYISVTLDGFHNVNVGMRPWIGYYPRLGVRMQLSAYNSIYDQIFAVRKGDGLVIDVPQDAQNAGKTHLRNLPLHSIPLPVNFQNPITIEGWVSSVKKNSPTLIEQGWGQAVNLASLAGVEVAAGAQVANSIFSAASTAIQQVFNNADVNDYILDSISLKPNLNGHAEETDSNTLRAGGVLFHTKELDAWIDDRGLEGTVITWNPEASLKNRLKVGGVPVPAGANIGKDFSYLVLRIKYIPTVIYNGNEIAYFHESLIPLLPNQRRVLSCHSSLELVETSSDYAGGTWPSLEVSSLKLDRISEKRKEIMNFIDSIEVFTSSDKSKLKDYYANRINIAVDRALADNYAVDTILRNVKSDALEKQRAITLLGHQELRESINRSPGTPWSYFKSTVTSLP